MMDGIRELAVVVVDKWIDGSVQPYALVNNNGRPDWYHPTDAATNHLEILAVATNPMDILNADWDEVAECRDDLIDAITEAWTKSWVEGEGMMTEKFVVQWEVYRGSGRPSRPIVDIYSDDSFDRAMQRWEWNNGDYPEIIEGSRDDAYDYLLDKTYVDEDRYTQWKAD